MTSPHRQQQIPELETVAFHMSISPGTTPIDWKSRYETLQFQYELELERMRLHYEHKYQERVTEMKIQMKRDSEHQFAELRARLYEQQQQQQLLNLSSSSVGLDQSIGEKVREQIRLAEEYERSDEDRRQQLLQQSTDSNELKRIINKLHTEGENVLSLSERLILRLNGFNISKMEDSVNILQKLNEENSLLRSMIGNMNTNESSNKLIKCLADIFRCEQERRLIQIRRHSNSVPLEQEILDMCSYQRDALAKFLSEDRALLIIELDQTKEQLKFLRSKFEQLKQTQNYSAPNKYYLKYIRCDNHRKALIYQKRYLLVLLTGYEDTETYALNEIRRLTGDTKLSSYPPNYDKMKFIRRQPFQRRSFNYRFQFRSAVQVVIAISRMRWLVRKWVQKSSAFK